MTFIDFISSLTFWEASLLILLTIIFIRCLAGLIFSPITNRLDQIINELKKK